MPLDFSKITYVDGSTVIGADNLNDIQDAILSLDSNKVEKIQGKGLSTEDYTNAEKTKLSGIEAGAQVNPGNATTSADGLMSSGDKAKLDGIAAGATAVTIDSTLTVAGQAADAKATGDALAEKYEKPSGGIPDSDIASASTWNAKGTYSKPSGGIPKSDLASDVQTSLGKADSALQSVPSTYRTAAEQDVIDDGKETAGLGLVGVSAGDLVRVKTVDANGKPTSWHKAAMCDITTNQNLLGNWYFVGGGSQSGDGVFPINQRGATSYSNVGEGIDRWLAYNGHCRLSVGADYCSFSTDGSAAYWNQEVSSPEALYGKVLTYSALIDGELYTATGTCPTTPPASGSTTIAALTPPGAAVFRTYLLNDGQVISRIGVAANETLNVQAVKLELGSYQTLAHMENGVWVLNELPDFGEELAKCQRHYVRFSGKYITTGFVSSGAKRYYMPIYLPQPMDNPTVNMAGWTGRLATGYCAHTNDGQAKAPTNIGIYQKSQNFVCVYDDIGTAVDTNNSVINYMIDGLEVIST